MVRSTGSNRLGLSNCQHPWLRADAAEQTPAAKEPVAEAAPPAAVAKASGRAALWRLLQTASHSSLLLAFTVQGWFQGAYFSLMPVTITAVYVRL